jgi:membrane-bound lytic murein transglycosylase D
MAMSNLARFLVSLVMLLLTASLQADENDFPIPANIRPAVDFWKRVYTEVDTQSGFLHDNLNLAIVYEALPRDSARIDQRRKQLISDIKVLASGRRSDLTASQQRILELWGSNISNERLALAAGSIRWQLGQSDRFREGLTRSGAYRQHIEAVARSKGMPVELAALPHVESSFHPGAFSSAAASGMWQFMRESAQRFMRVDAIVDERLDPYKASYGAMDMLKLDYQALGSWPLALTAYNHGANGIARAVRDTGSRDIGKIISDYRGSRFGFASRNFYPQFLAVLEVERDVERYFGKIAMHRQPEFVEYELPAFLDATVVAGTLGVSLQDLKRDNPALQPVIWNGNKRIPKGYMLKIDRSAFSGNLVASMDAIPANQFFTDQIPDVSYTVRSGDSLSVIASRYKTSVSELVTINQLRDRNSIRAGQNLILPQQNGGMPTLVVSNAAAQSVPDSGRYDVRRGDTLTTIASRYKVATATLMALNNLNSRSVIYPGQTLRLAAEATQPMAAAPVAEQLEESLQVMDAEVTIASVVDEVAVVPAAESVASAAFETQPGTLAPIDYGVAADNTIEILNDETLGHFADWLGLSSASLRSLNQLRTNATVWVGDRIALDFSKVQKAAFEAKRREYHSGVQAQYFASYRISDTETYSIKNSEVLGNLARQRSVPMWLLRQYNPAITDTSRIKVGQVVVFPVVEKL